MIIFQAKQRSYFKFVNLFHEKACKIFKILYMEPITFIDKNAILLQKKY